MTGIFTSLINAKHHFRFHRAESRQCLRIFLSLSVDFWGSQKALRGKPVIAFGWNLNIHVQNMQINFQYRRDRSRSQAPRHSTQTKSEEEARQLSPHNKNIGQLFSHKQSSDLFSCETWCDIDVSACGARRQCVVCI